VDAGVDAEKGFRQNDLKNPKPFTVLKSNAESGMKIESRKMSIKNTLTRKPVTDDEIRSISQDMRDVASGITKVASRIADAMDRDPETINRICSLNPDADRRLLFNLDRVGRKQLHSELLFAHSAGAALAARLPYAEQEKALARYLPVAVKTSTGVNIVQRNLAELTFTEARTVFDVYDKKKVRTPAEQKVIVESFAAKPRSPVRYRDEGETVCFYVSRFKWTELADMVELHKRRTMGELGKTMTRNQVTKGK
jgi:hypothetical protein